MKILVVSDTHGRTEVLSELLKKYGSEIEMLCHAGDGASDIWRFERKYPHIKMVAVAGNSDYNVRNESEYLIDLIVSEKKIRIFVTHGHAYGVKRDFNALLSASVSKSANACFFGHTHNPVVFEQSGILFLNPGSLGFPHEYNVHTYGIAEISSDGDINGELRKFNAS